MRNFYILVDKEPKLVKLKEWALWFEKADRQLALHKGENWRLSTVFMGIESDYHPDPAQLPLIFETAFFCPELDFDGNQWLSSSYDEAIAQHFAILSLIQHELGEESQKS